MMKRKKNTYKCKCGYMNATGIEKCYICGREYKFYRKEQEKIIKRTEPSKDEIKATIKQQDKMREKFKRHQRKQEEESTRGTNYATSVVAGVETKQSEEEVSTSDLDTSYEFNENESSVRVDDQTGSPNLFFVVFGLGAIAVLGYLFLKVTIWIFSCIVGGAKVKL